MREKGSFIAGQIMQEYYRKKYYSEKFKRQKCKEIECDKCKYEEICEDSEEK